MQWLRIGLYGILLFCFRIFVFECFILFCVFYYLFCFMLLVRFELALKEAAEADERTLKDSNNLPPFHGGITLPVDL
jgi:hypothetical protein